MRRVVITAIFVVAGLAPIAGLPTAAGGQEAAFVTKVGWWTRNPAAQAPEGGMNVASTPDGGPVSVAAIEIRSASALQSASVILDEEAQIFGESAALQVCTTPNQWKAGAAQSYDDAPKPECDGAVPLRRNAATATWGADVTPLVADIEDEGSVSLMIVPTAPATPVASEIRFEKPTLQATAAPSSSDTNGSFSSGTSSFGGGTSTDFGNSGVSSPTFAPSGPDTTGSVAPVAPTTADGAAGAPPTAVPDAPSSTGELAALPTQASTAVDAGTGNTTLQALFFVFVATVAGIGGGVARWFTRRRNPDASFA